MMRNEYPKNCAKCGERQETGQGIVHTRGHRSPFPVLCDSCMQIVDDEQQENERFDRDGY